MAELIPGVTYEEFVAATGRARTEAEFRQGPFFARHGEALDQLLRTPRLIAPLPATASEASSATASEESADRRSITLAHWNIEKGNELGRIVRRFADDPLLAGADIISLNEVDDGMARSGNADVAAALAQARGMGGAYLPNYVECTKGLPAERLVPGSNRLGLHGVALLTRHPIVHARAFPLPAAWDYFDYSEKRLGGRSALLLRIATPVGEIDAVSVHLEMRSPPAGRERQFHALLAALNRHEQMEGTRPTLVAGDFNTHTFSRGRPGDTIRGFVRIVGSDRALLVASLLDPREREPLLAAAESAGYRIDGLNDNAPTAWQKMGELEDLRFLPPFAGRILLRMFSLAGTRLPLRLDWILGEGGHPARSVDPLGGRGGGGSCLGSRGDRGAGDSGIRPMRGDLARSAPLAIFLLLAASCRAEPPAPATPPSAPSPAIDDRFWKWWGDGRAEVSGYDLVQPRYGTLRNGTAVLIFVTETFADDLRVKSDPGRRPASEEFPVMKLNAVEDFSTGIYDYNLLTSSFTALAPIHGRPTGAPTKVSFSSQEWCGHVYAQALFDSASVRITSHSYFDGEADRSETIDGVGLLSEDALFVWARGLAWPIVTPGDSLSVPLLRSLKAARLRHRPVEPLVATLAVIPGSTTITVPGGSFAVESRTATISDGRSWRFEVESEAPHRLIRWSGSDGEEGSYLGGERVSYWTMNGPGFESELKRLGLTPRPPRTP